MEKSNSDRKVVNDFGDEWNIFKQDTLPENMQETFEEYFSIFPSEYLSKELIGFDAGCGSGRWAKFIAPNVKQLTCIDPSTKALEISKYNLRNFNNCIFECCSINDSKIRNNTQDFGYSLGVLHHTPDTKKALKSCVDKLKPGSPFLLYLYYSLDNKNFLFKLIWIVSNIGRLIISKLPFFLKLPITTLIATLIYFPLARFSLILDKLGFDVSSVPLSYYRKRPFYFMLTDSLDRFGTKLEKRFSKKEIHILMEQCGLESIEFRNKTPFWVSLGYKKK